MMDGFTEAAAEATFCSEVESSLRLPAQVGNIYTGSLYLALASLLCAEVDAIEGQRIGLFSYGSGCAAEFFAGRVADGAPEVVRALDIDAPLRACRRLTIPEYEELRRADHDADRRPAPKDVESKRPTANGHVTFLGIDEGERRVYAEA